MSHELKRELPNWMDFIRVWMDRPMWFNSPVIPSERLILARLRVRGASA